MDVTLFSTGCPRCKVLAKKLDSKGITYKVVDDVDEMVKMGIFNVPYLSVDGTLMSFKESIDWVNTVE